LQSINLFVNNYRGKIIFLGAKSFGPMVLDHLVQALLLDLMLGGIGLESYS
jgi:hypothetical protein